MTGRKELSMLRMMPVLLLLIVVYAESSLAQCSPSVVVAYYSQTGRTRVMAEAVANGAIDGGADVAVLPVDSVTTEQLVGADAVIVGSPVHNANVALPVQEFILRWPFLGGEMRDKLGAAFVSAGGISAGEETTQLAILRSMLIYGMIVVGGGEWQSAFGASAVTEEAPFLSEAGQVNEQFLEKARGLGSRVAGLARQMACP
jgi:NAD(P)H dehydrogenase (quinone)